MINIIVEEGRVKPGIYEFVIDEATDLSEMPTNAKPGSTAKCIDDSKTYMLNGSGDWIEINFNSSVVDNSQEK